MARSRLPFRENLKWYLSLTVLVLFFLVPPLLCGLLYLSWVPDVVWSRDELTFDRVWMYRTRRPAGIAYQSQRVIETYSPSEVCVQNTVHFWLWSRVEGAVGTTSSHTMVRVGNQWQSTGQSCR